MILKLVFRFIKKINMIHTKLNRLVLEKTLVTTQVYNVRALLYKVEIVRVKLVTIFCSPNEFEKYDTDPRCVKES